jgi:hypothetical protein
VTTYLASSEGRQNWELRSNLLSPQVESEPESVQ